MPVLAKGWHLRYVCSLCPAPAGKAAYIVTEHVRLISPNGIQGALVTAVDNSTQRWRCFHESYTIATVLPPTADDSSGGEVKYRRWRYATVPGVLMLMEPGELHVTMSLSGRANFRLLQLEADSVNRIAEELGIRSPVHWQFPVVCDASLHDEFTHLHGLIERNAEAHVQDAQFSRALVRVLQTCAEQSIVERSSADTRREVRQMRSYIEQNFRGRIHLDEIAQSSGVSRYRVDQLFSQAFGVSPLQYQRELRLAHARTLLARGWRLADVAHEVGFYDHSQFCRYFKRSLGLSPGGYALATKRNDP